MLKELKMIKKIFLSTICIVVFVSCSSSKKNNNLIYGVVYDSSGTKTLSGARIYNGKKYISSTDFQGRFSFANSFGANQLTIKKNGYEEKVAALDDSNSLDFIRVKLESYEDLCFLCHDYLTKHDFDNACDVLLRIEKINKETYEYALLMSVYEFYVNNYDSSYIWLCCATERKKNNNVQLIDFKKLLLSKLEK